MKRRAFALILVGVLAGCATLVEGGAALAAEARSFDATLSLTGDCTVEGVDPVADPGCPSGIHPPAGPFLVPKSIATDSYGDIYVASYGNESEYGRDGRVDVFDASGRFITEIVDPRGPTDLAVDDEGNLYVYNFRVAPSQTEEHILELVRYAPTSYLPGSGEIAYGSTAVLVDDEVGSSSHSLAVDPTNGHLFGNDGGSLREYGSAAEGNVVLDESIGAGELHSFWGTGLALNAADGRLYVNDGNAVAVYELAAPHARLQTIERSATPAGGSFDSQLSVAVDEASGHFFVYDGGSTEAIYEFAEDGTYLSTISHGIQHTVGSQITVDNGAHSPNGALNPNGRYLFVPSGGARVGHAFAFSANPAECAPEVAAISFAGVTETEVELGATVNPCNAETGYAFEYTPEWSYEESGFQGAEVIARGQLAAGGTPIEVGAAVSGLEAGVAYRFRLRATNAIGIGEKEGRFSTYPASPVTSACPNSALRGGLSALLPDCRAYELVTPAVTNARAPIGVGHLGIYFATLQGSPDGEKVSFDIEGGSIPGIGGTGSFAGDPYLATRTAAGWTTSYMGPGGGEAPALLPGSTSPDQGWAFWATANGEGSAAVDEGTETSYLRSPDGGSRLLGVGSLGDEPRAVGDFIGEGGGHVIFSTSRSGGRAAAQLEPDAPPTGTAAIYDRTGTTTHVVSLLPGDVTPGAGEDAAFLGASRDGRGIAFTVGAAGGGEALYLRYDDSETFKVGEGVTFAGVAEGGARIFYLEGGNLFAFDAANGSVTSFSTGGEVTVVNVAADGGTAFFVSPRVLSKVPNSAGQKAKAGKDNLYRSEEGSVSFIGTVTSREVEGENGGAFVVDGLGLWTTAVGRSSSGPPGRLGLDPSRSTPDGRYLLFESRAALGPYDPQGHAEVYRYDAGDEDVSCLSCMPTGAPAVGEASLESVSQAQSSPEPFGAYALVENLSTDGGRAFFQSTEQLVPGDTGGLQDVYEWEADGVGSCARHQGCVYLISSGRSAAADYLFAVSESGGDVFFRSPDVLLASDAESTPSIFDARVGGGFAEATESECDGEGCRPDLTPALVPPTPASVAPGARDNVRPRLCPKGKKKVKRHGASRCVRLRPKRPRTARHERQRHHQASKGAGK